MEIIELLLLSAALSIDALSIGVSCGFGEIRMSLCARGVVLLVSIVLTGISVAVGAFLNGMISPLVGKLIGAVLLFLIGGYMIAGALRPSKAEKSPQDGVLISSARMLRSPDVCDPDHSKSIDYKEACMIGIALSADSFAAGLSAGISGGYAFLVPIFCGVIQTLLLSCGELLAGKLRLFVSADAKWFSIAAGLILIGTGLCRVIL